MRIIIVIALLFLIISCTRSVTNPTPLEATFIKFKVNGIQEQFDGGFSDITDKDEGVYANKTLYNPPNTPKTYYSLTGKMGANRVIEISFVTDSLKVGTYSSSYLFNNSSDVNAMTVILVDTLRYVNYRSTDILTTNITRNSGGSIDGTFSGKLSSAKTLNGNTTYTEATITEGEFKNVKVQY